MKHSSRIIILIAMLLLFAQVSVFADDTGTGASEAVTEEPAQDPAPTPDPENQEPANKTSPSENEYIISIAPDSPLYPVKLMIESISINLAFDETSKAELLVEYANRRIGEAEIMQENDNQELAAKLVEESLALVEKANTLLEYADESETEQVQQILMNLSQVQDHVVISLQFMLKDGINQDNIDQLIQKTEEEMIKTVVTNAFLVSKDNFFDSKDAFFAAKDAYKAALESGDESAIAAAYEALLASEALKDELESVKDEFENLKDNVKDSLDIDNDNDDNNDQEKIKEDKDNNGKALGKDKDKSDDDDDDHDDDDDDDHDDDDDDDDDYEEDDD